MEGGEGRGGGREEVKEGVGGGREGVSREDGNGRGRERVGGGGEKGRGSEGEGEVAEMGRDERKEGEGRDVESKTNVTMIKVEKEEEGEEEVTGLLRLTNRTESPHISTPDASHQSSTPKGGDLG